MNLEELLKSIERYDFECEGGPLVNCAEWMTLKRFVKFGDANGKFEHFYNKYK